MHLRYNYRIEPTPGQVSALARAFGCARVVFNDALRLREDTFRAGLPYLSDAAVLKAVTTDAKRMPERAWLSEVSSAILIQAVHNLNSAYRGFFASASGKRKGAKVGHPRFRSRRDSQQTISFMRHVFKIANGKLRLAKIGEVKVRWSRALPSIPSSVTIIRDAA